ncbi:MAG TPA: class I adenylate-forming enzyme family protein [Solirubrobacteraceae bacterium]|jgi:acyl-coenzyme A synthetase/AMP-(fatty) acid ligase|nr:class I adenylate-forming enzyme family protein [Solirubrobacteraceae bacterium]
MRLTRLRGPVNLGEMFELAAQRHPDRPIVTDRPPDIDPTASTASSYAGWAQRVVDTAAWLHAAGVVPGDRVAMLKANHADMLVLACATARLGAIPALLAWSHSPESAATLLERLDRPVLVTDRARLSSCGLDAERLRRLTRRTIVVDAGASSEGVLALDDVRGGSAPPPAYRGSDEAMVIAHTSGTTGIPKLVQHSANTIRLLSRVETEPWPVLGISSDDCAVVCNPYSHARFTTMLTAVTTICPKLVFLSEPAIDAARPLIAEHRPTIVEAPPNAFLYWESMAAEAPSPFAHVRMYANTFDAIHVRTVRAFLEASRRRFPVWVQGWGQSEAGPVTVAIYTRRSVRRSRRRPVTQNVGFPLPFMTKVRIVDPATFEPQARGKPGLVEVRQRGRFLGYVGEDERLDRKERDGWWNMGDVAIKTRAGSLRLVDREVDRLEGASGIELEDVLLDRLPELAEVVMLAVKGGKPIPVVATADEAPLSPARWSGATAGMPPLADPVQLPWKDIPRTATWKVRRPLLRELVRPGAQAVGSSHWT